MDSCTNNKALMLEESLLFEQGHIDKTGVDFTDESLNDASASAFLGDAVATQLPNIPSLSEPETIRHYTRLSQKNYSIDSGLFPLGSCTMKYNPRLNERVARLDGIANIHPLQPISSVQGMLAMLDECALWLKELTAMDDVALSPAAGAQGELCGMMAIKEALKDKPHKRVILVPESAHGTNPATAITCGFVIQNIKSGADGRVDLDDVKKYANENLAGIMLTNPNTCGLFEKDIQKIADVVHEHGGFFYCDGANFNALIGKIAPGELGIDAMHINIHKTLSTPHGGGGPGAGPVVFSSRLSQYAPYPRIVFDNTSGTFVLHEKTQDATDGTPFGRLKQFHGQVGLLMRALCYMMSMGKDGLAQVAEDAVLNANYILTRLRPAFGVPYGVDFCMHEVLLDETSLQGTDISVLDFVKCLIDEGFHPMTVYFPLVVKGAMLIEPTETESKGNLDQFIDTMLFLLEQARSGKHLEHFKQAPHYAPRKRADEVRAARQPILTAVDTQ